MVVRAQYASEHFEEPLSATNRGEEVEISREDRPALTLVAKRTAEPHRPESELVGLFRGQMWVSSDFDSPELNKEIEDEFLNGPVFPNLT